MGVTPVVAIVGRPNVGKSTLFNRLLGRRKAIVHNKPGVTRDRITDLVEIEDEFHVLLIDTGGLVPGDDPLGLNQQVLLAVEESDLVLLVVDGKDGLAAADEKVWHEIRRFGKPTILVVNKADTRAAQRVSIRVLPAGHRAAGPPFRRAQRGSGGASRAGCPTASRARRSRRARGPRLAIVGRPNVGKSSLLNRLLGQERALVSEVPGTTRDPIDTVVYWDEKPFVLVDTAGIRRRGRAADAPEEVAIMMARRQLDQSDLALLVVDASQGITSGDLTIAGTAWELGKACLVLANKWDLVDEDKREKLEETWLAPRRDLVRPRPSEYLCTDRQGSSKGVPGSRRNSRKMPSADSAQPISTGYSRRSCIDIVRRRWMARSGRSCTRPRSRRPLLLSCFLPTVSCLASRTIAAIWRTVCGGS